MKTIHTVFLCLLLFIGIACQNTTPTDATESEPENSSMTQEESKTPDSAEAPSVRSYPLDGYLSKELLLLDTLSGDLNMDEYRDLLLVIKRKDEEVRSDTMEQPLTRQLLVLLGTADGTYTLGAGSSKTVLCYDCGGIFGDPYSGLAIKNGYFSVEHYGGSNWRWTRIITYKYDPEADYWFLHQDGSESYHTAEPDKVETQIRTTKDFGRVRIEDFDIYAEH